MIIKFYPTIFLVLFSLGDLFAQEKILITEATINLNLEQTKELFFSLAKGDIIELDLEMIKGKHVKEVEISELSGNTIFSEFKVKKIENKKIQIKTKGLYKFRFYSSSLTKRVCRIKINRIPKNDTTRDFNTNWQWKTVRDTIYTPYTIDSIAGYSTVKYKETVRELVQKMTVEDLLFNKNQKVHSLTNLQNDNKTFLRVDLPNTINSELIEEQIIAWAYWIGVGEEAQRAYRENSNSASELVKEVASFFSSPLGGLAIGAISDLAIPKTGHDIAYVFIPDYENAMRYTKGLDYMQFDMGKGIAAYGRNSNIKEGTFYIGLYNDNISLGLDVDVKVVVVKEVKTFEMKESHRERPEPIIVTLNKTRMDIIESKVRVPLE